MRALVLIAGLLALLPAVANAGDYGPGSVGFLYEDCQKALESSRSLPELHGTYCGAFVEGYIAAYAASSANAALLRPGDKNDPCAADKEKVYERVSNRFCRNLPFYDEKKVTASYALHDMTDIVSRWIGYLKEKNGGDPFALKASDEVGTLLRPGEFCSRIGVRESDIPSLFVTNPELQKISWQDSLKLKASMTFASKYEQCHDDLIRTAENPSRFRATRCGAEIEGFIAGLHATSYLQKNRGETSPECSKQIDRLYKSLDATASMCVNTDTDPSRVAKIFLRQVDRKSVAEKKAIPASIGYETIYRGFLCVDNSDEG